MVSILDIEQHSHTLNGHHCVVSQCNSDIRKHMDDTLHMTHFKWHHPLMVCIVYPGIWLAWPRYHVERNLTTIFKQNRFVYILWLTPYLKWSSNGVKNIWTSYLQQQHCTHFSSVGILICTSLHYQLRLIFSRYCWKLIKLM